MSARLVSNHAELTLQARVAGSRPAADASDRDRSADGGNIRVLHAAAPCIEKPAPIRIYTLGRFEIVANGEVLSHGRKAQRRVLDLLKAHAALGPAGVSCNVVAGALWPYSEGDAARGAFEVTLHRLRKFLGRDDALHLSHGMLRLNADVAWTDSIVFEQAAALATDSHGVADLGAAERALALYAGPFLHNEEDAPWLLPARERLRSRYLRLATRVAQHFRDAGRPGHATETYATALEAEPLAEELYRGLMGCLAADGRHAEAVVVYRRCSQMLLAVHGVEPSHETNELWRTIARAA
jgi:DNA-binding SARP family transcriptional activator